MRYPLPGDRILWITISPVVTAAGERTGVVGLVKDMTEMELLERTRREYVANVSHELRTPLTAVRGLLEPLADGMVQSEEDRQRYYRIMLREVVRLSRLITDMMQLSRLQAGTEYMELIEVDINEILEDVRQNYVKEAAQRGIRLELDAPGLPHVLTDPDRVEQLLVILLDNAMRYTPEGGAITIYGEDGPRVNICVTDTGCGIPGDIIDRIFDPYFTTKEKDLGTGLGLAVVRGIVEKIGGAIRVETRTGEGSTFHILLPSMSCLIDHQPMEDDDPLPRGAERILIVDDEPALADVGRQMLEDLGYVVISSTEILEALKLFKTEPNRFDLILTDYTMPRMTGETFARAVWKIRPELPVIVHTGHSGHFNEERALAAGFAAFVRKPFSPIRLAKIVRQVLDEYRNRS
jgi:CheY-like chemotaxis protein